MYPTDQLVGPKARNLMLVCRQLPPQPLPSTCHSSPGNSWDGNEEHAVYSHIPILDLSLIFSLTHTLFLALSFSLLSLHCLSVRFLSLSTSHFSLFISLLILFLSLSHPLVFNLARANAALRERFLCTQVVVMHVADHNTKTTC